MENILDTHTFIWFIEGSEELSKYAKKAIENKNSTNYLSIASLWEMAIKIAANKLTLKASFSDIYDIIQQNGFEILPIKFEDTLLLSNLPYHHRDPFDRMIIAQCISNKFNLISKDKEFKSYPVPLLW